MKIKENTRKTYAALFLIILICNCMMLFIFGQKKQFHIDEVWTYALSNSHEKPFLFFWQIGSGEIGSESRTYQLKEGEEDPFFNDSRNTFYEQWHSGEEFHDYLTVQENQRFDYSGVYYNQVCDIHPPLYYFLTHTLCSFFPDTFSKWFAASLNMLFFSLSIIVLFFLARHLLNSDKKAILACMVWAFSRCGISNAVFLRMYMLMTLLVLLLAYLHMLMVENFKAKYIVLIFAVNVCGFLTQYYFYIFSFFITASVCFYLLFKKKFKQLFIYAFTVIASVGTAILIFPATLVHLERNAYTGRANSGFAFGSNKLITYLIQDYTGLAEYRRTIVADLLPVAVIILISAYLLIAYKKKINLKDKFKAFLCNIRADYAILIISMFVSGFVTMELAPAMPWFNDRYIFPLLPLFSIPFISIICFLADKAAERLKKKKDGFKYAAVLLMAFVLASNVLNENRYLGKTLNTEETDKMLEEIADEGTFYYVADKEYIIHSFSTMFRNSYMVYPSHELDEALTKRINDNEVNVGTAYIIIESTAADEDYMAGEKTGINYFLNEALAHDFEFITDFYFGNDIYGDLYYLYEVHYS